MDYLRVDEEITLHVPKIEEAERFYAVIDRNREHLGKWLDFVPKTTDPDVTRGVIERWCRASAEETGFNYVIEYRGSIVGACGAPRLAKNQHSAEIGYWLSEDVQGRGIATRCCLSLLRWLFEDRKLNRVEIRAAAPNRKSRAVAERLGFKLDGILRENVFLNGKYYDEAIYSMLAREYSESITRLATP
jgi:ribosomal-protein-serine acetyltransferase